MTKQFDDRNRGSIWANKKKREGKQDPDFTGSLNVDGHDYWVSAWKRRPDAGANSPALSFSVKQKDGKPASSGTERRDAGPSYSKADTVARQTAAQEMDDEIPW